MTNKPTEVYFRFYEGDDISHYPVPYVFNLIKKKT